MKVSYDRQTDSLTVVFVEDATVAESEEEKTGVVIDYDAAGKIVAIEILDASRYVSDAVRIEAQANG